MLPAVISLVLRMQGPGSAIGVVGPTVAAAASFFTFAAPSGTQAYLSKIAYYIVTHRISIIWTMPCTAAGDSGAGDEVTRRAVAAAIAGTWSRRC